MPSAVPLLQGIEEARVHTRQGDPTSRGVEAQADAEPAEVGPFDDDLHQRGKAGAVAKVSIRVSRPECPLRAGPASSAALLGCRRSSAYTTRVRRRPISARAADCGGAGDVMR